MGCTGHGQLGQIGAAHLCSKNVRVSEGHWPQEAEPDNVSTVWRYDDGGQRYPSKIAFQYWSLIHNDP